MPSQREHTLTESSVVVANKEVSYTADLDEEMILLSLTKGEYYGMNPIAGQIWNWIQEPKRVNDLQDVILKEYDVQPDRCKKDLLALLKQLADEDLIKVTNENSV